MPFTSDVLVVVCVSAPMSESSVTLRRVLDSSGLVEEPTSGSTVSITDSFLVPSVGLSSELP